MRICCVLALSGLGCAPPPLVPLTGPDVDEPGIELLYPEPGQVVELDDDCELDVVLVVWTTAVLLTEPDPNNVVDGEAHWHGGPSLMAGYCCSSSPSCDTYDGSLVRPGLLTLQVQLQDSAHSPIGAEDQVEVEIVEPTGVICP